VPGGARRRTGKRDPDNDSDPGSNSWSSEPPRGKGDVAGAMTPEENKTPQSGCHARHSRSCHAGPAGRANGGRAAAGRADAGRAAAGRAEAGRAAAGRADAGRAGGVVDMISSRPSRCRRNATGIQITDCRFKRSRRVSNSRRGRSARRRGCRRSSVHDGGTSGEALHRAYVDATVAACASRRPKARAKPKSR